MNANNEAPPDETGSYEEVSGSEEIVEGELADEVNLQESNFKRKSFNNWCLCALCIIVMLVIMFVGIIFVSSGVERSRKYTCVDCLPEGDSDENIFWTDNADGEEG